MKSFDDLLNATPEGGTISLDGGAYVTRRTGQAVGGGAIGKRGVTIKGNGSIVILETESQGAIDTIYGLDLKRVENLTIDCGGSRLLPHKRNGLCIEGTEPVSVENVTVLRAYGKNNANYSEAEEAFPFFLWSGKADVLNCTVADVRGDYCTAFTGAGGSWMGCKALFPEFHAESDRFFGFNIGDSHDLLIQRGLVANATSGVYSDTGSASNIAITDSDFLDCDTATTYVQGGQAGQVMEDVRFSSNRVRLSGKSVQAFLAMQDGQGGIMRRLAWEENEMTGAPQFEANLSAKIVGSMSEFTFSNNRFPQPTRRRNAGDRAAMVVSVSVVRNQWDS